jgi:hypothetical protein
MNRTNLKKVKIIITGHKKKASDMSILEIHKRVNRLILVLAGSGKSYSIKK